MRPVKVAVVAIALWPAAAAGHPEDASPQHVSRYLSVALLRDSAALSCAFVFGKIPAAAERRRWDTNRDGAIDDAETARGRARWAGQMPALCTVAFDGQVQAVDAVASVDLGGDRSTGQTPLVIEVGGILPLATNVGRVDLSAGADVPPAGETELSLSAGSSWTVRGPNPARPQVVTFSGPRSDVPRAATFYVSRGAAGEQIPRAKGPRRAAAAVAAVGLVVAAWLAARHRHRRRSIANEAPM